MAFEFWVYSEINLLLWSATVQVTKIASAFSLDENARDGGVSWTLLQILDSNQNLSCKHKPE